MIRSMRLVRATLVVLALQPASLCTGQDSYSVDGPRQQAAEAAILAKLRQPITWSLEAPPIDIVRGLLDERQISFVIDHEAIKRKRADTAAEAAFHANAITIESALNLLLEPLQLGWTIRDEAVFITSEHELNEATQIRFYPIQDLIEEFHDTAYDFTDFEDWLIESITTHIYPANWDEVGGVGTLSVDSERKVLICSQTRKGHTAIEHFLSALRKAEELQRNGSAKGASVQSPVNTRVRKTSAKRHRVYARSPAWAIPRMHD